MMNPLILLAAIAVFILQGVTFLSSPLNLCTSVAADSSIPGASTNSAAWCGKRIVPRRSRCTITALASIDDEATTSCWSPVLAVPGGNPAQGREVTGSCNRTIAGMSLTS